MARAKIVRTTTMMIADVDFDYVTAGRPFNVTVTYRDGKPSGDVDFRRAAGDTDCGTYVAQWQYRRQLASGNLHPVAA
jgi:hypothetical protein